MSRGCWRSAAVVDARRHPGVEWRQLDPVPRDAWQAEDDGEGFYGVDFGEDDDEDRIVGINLDNEAHGTASPCIGRLAKLEYLNLGFNDITSLPREMGNLTSLDTMSLYKNQLESVPDEIGDCVSLKTLELRRNLIAQLPTSIGRLTALETAHFSRNVLTSVPAELGQLAGNLKKLELKKNEGLTASSRLSGR